MSKGVDHIGSILGRFQIVGDKGLQSIFKTLERFSFQLPTQYLHLFKVLYTMNESLHTYAGTSWIDKETIA